MNILAYDWNINPESLEEGCKQLKEFQQKILYLKQAKFRVPKDVPSGLALEECWHDPYLFKDMEKAVRRLTLAKERQECLLIHGDYDVDGITATAILSLFFEKVGIPYKTYIPNRLEEGYGITQTSLQYILKTQIPLLVTVDCGITAVQEMAYLKEKGIDVILTDHHQQSTQLPQVYALINPSVKEEPYPFGRMCGASVALKLVHALCTAWNLGELWKSYLPLAVLGTVADVMPLCSENLWLLREGLSYMNEQLKAYRETKKDACVKEIPFFENQFTGLYALFQQAVCAKNPDELFSTQLISYFLAPRINAAGRMGQAYLALELFLSSDAKIIQEKIQQLETLNEQRKNLEQEASKIATQLLSEKENLANEQVLMVYSPNIHPGILGIVAAKLSQKLFKPAIVFSLEENSESQEIYLKGSARSFTGINVLELIREAGEGLLDQVGGHMQAAGLTLNEKYYNLFKENMHRITQAKKICFERPKMPIDLVLEAEDLTLENAEFLERLGPYGEGQPEFRFMVKDAVIQYIQRVGTQGGHLQFKVYFSHFKKSYACIYFFAGALEGVLKAGQKIDLVFRMQINHFRGNRLLQLVIDDLHIQAFCAYPLEQDARVQGLLESGHPYFNPMQCIQDKRDHFLRKFKFTQQQQSFFGQFYQFLKGFLEQEKGLALIELAELAHHLTWIWDCPYHLDLTRLILNIFEEAEIIEKFCFCDQPEIYILKLSKVKAGKVRLSQTPSYQILMKEYQDLWK